MKSYVTSGTGAQQTLTGSQDEKVAVYQTLADAEADLANLEAGQIVATPDTGDENAQPVDVIQAGNMHAVTSNAVATSNAMPVDEVTLNNVHSVTSNAVYEVTNRIVNNSFYNADTDRAVVNNRTNAIRDAVASLGSNIFSIRYAGGYYLSYFVNNQGAEKTVLEINCYDGWIAIYQITSSACFLVKQIS